jgi:hypothetical protein
MTVYTIDKYTFTRRLLDPGEGDYHFMITSGGNKSSSFVGNDELGMPMIECIYKPKDSEIYGVRWITKNITS